MKIKRDTKLGEWQKKLRNTESKCSHCGRIYYLTIDHIIPIVVLQSLNLIDEVYNWEENFEIICGACNKLKAGRLDISNPKTYFLLEEAVRKSKSQLK